MSKDEWKGSSFVAEDMIGQKRMAGCLVIKEALCMALEKGYQAVTMNWCMCLMNFLK